MVRVDERIDTVDCYLGAAKAEHSAAGGLGSGEAREGEEGEELHRGGEGSKSEGRTEENLREEAKNVISFGRKVFIQKI